MVHIVVGRDRLLKGSKRRGEGATCEGEEAGFVWRRKGQTTMGK